MNIYEKLLEVQTKLKAPKGQFNSFGNYSYRSCEDIQEAVKPFLGELKAILVVGDELELIGDRYYIKSTASFIDCESGDKVSNTSFAREELAKKGMDSSQITGSTSSYARKYALNGLFALDDTKDADTQDNTKNDNKGNTKPNNQQQAGKKVDRQSLIETFEKEIERTGKSLKWFLEQAGTTEVKYMKNAKLEEFIEMLKKLPAKAR